ncbi:hypothetical protein H8B09_12975 [Paenibacillus sp. PR3]|uniref:YhfM-like domain-containing protein n=1 Tax=Paenibacillus terricola TaxID=2763503 RepID=A0ABR8MUM8_9BACL|nr:hypothetical protein [Paenibacillus terricola]MBD3919670.1 hypothetical protein [Paenibacillus terricola]
MMRLRLNGLLFVCIIALTTVLSGCGNEKSQSIALQQVRLESTSSLIDSGKAPFKEQTFSAPNELVLFKRMLDEAEPREGKLDYAPMFNVEVTFVDGGSKQYYMAIDPSAELRGLLVEAADSEQGYTIDTKQSSELSRLIYGVQ